MTTTEDEARVLNRIQTALPLCRRPFLAIGESLGLSEGDVIARLAAARQRGLLRQLSAIFDTAALGYHSSLVAMRVCEDQLEWAASVVSTHPGVSHNYRRDHSFNLWFTIAVPPRGDLGWTIQRLATLAGAAAVRPLPTVRLYKIGVSLDMTGKRLSGAREDPGSQDVRLAERFAGPLTERDIELVRALQDDLELIPEPFARAATRLGVSQEQLLEHAVLLQDQGLLRRIAGVLRHRDAGYTANGMVVWAVPEDRVDEIGNVMASFHAVSHCYRRPTYPDWSYNIFTMIHGRTRADCEDAAAAIESATGVRERAVLYSTTEYKKVRLLYFTPELDSWEERERQKERAEAKLEPGEMDVPVADGSGPPRE